MRDRRGSFVRIRSGSSGRSVTHSPRPVFDASTPALAHTKPCLVRLMTSRCSMRTISADSRRTTSTWRAIAIPSGGANSTASGRGSTVRQVDQAALSLGHDLLGNYQDVAARGARTASSEASSRHASAISAGRSSPGLISGNAGRGTARIEGTSAGLWRRRARPRSRRRSARAEGAARDRDVRDRLAYRDRSPAADRR